MEIIYGMLIAVAWMTLVLFTRSITTLLHELGHALPALAFGKKEVPVQVFVGSYGDISRTLRLSFGRLELFLKFNFFDWKLGMCQHGGAEKLWQQFLITLCGPIASLLISSIALGAIIFYQLPEAWIIVASLFITSALIDFAVNIYPSERPIEFYDNSVGYSDGYWLSILLQRLTLPKGYFELEKLHNEKKYEETIQRGKALINGGAKNRAIFDLILAAYIDKKEYGEAIDFYHELNENHKINQGDHLILSELMLKVNDLDEALKHVNFFLHKNYGNAIALNRRGYIFLQKNELEEASLDLSNALRFAPYSAEVHGNLGVLQLKNRDFPAALERFEFALKIDEKNAQVWFQKGLYHEERWHWAEALACFEKAKALGYEYHGLEMKIAEMDHLTNH